jgi:outer membrane protein assembly factor BamB
MVRNGVVVTASPEEEKHDGFSVRKEAGKFNDALEDFNRYRDKKAWELAFRSLEQLGQAKKDGMVPAGDGFYVPSRVRMLQGLTSLPPDGKQAFRLFYDAKAKQLFDRVEAAAVANDSAQPGEPVDEIATLREISDKYFITSVGDRASDRLGDALFESGDFAGAASAWGAILKDYPETSLPRLRLHVKRCTALARTGQWDLFDQSARDVRGEFAGQRVTVGGKEVVATEYLQTLRAAPATVPTPAIATQPTTGPATQPAVQAPLVATGPLALPKQDKPAWQVRLLDETLGKKLQAAFSMNQWGVQWSTLRTAVPASVTDGRRVYVNWLGIVFAADAETGKLVWRSRKFSELGDKFPNFINMMVDTDCYSTTLANGRLFVTGINIDRLNNYQEPVRLVCMNAADGKVKWSSASGSLSNWSVAGAPVVVGETVFLTVRARQSLDMTLMALGAEKGELQWQVLLGTAAGGTNYRGEQDAPSPLIVPTGGPLIYVVTNNGALLAVDIVGRRLQWAYTYEAPPIMNRNGWWGGEPIAARPKMSAAAFVDGSTLYLKEEGGNAIHAVDLNAPSLRWRRPLDSENTVLPLGGGRVLSAGQDVGVIDTMSEGRKLTWSLPLPQLAGRITPLVNDGRAFVFAPRGVYEIDLGRGGAVRIFRGYDRDSNGGAVLRAPGRLITVSNLAVTAYPTGDAAAARQALKN